jgi:DNA/RNA endonuclease YhcR with UshA esterase domain
MKKMTTGWLAVFAMLVSAGSQLAHHSLTNFDTTKAVHVKGTIVQFHQINPHSFIFVDEKGPDGQIHRWAVEGPSIIQLNRTGFAKDTLKAGDVIEVCGYVPKEATMWQIASADPSVASLAGRLINAEVMLMPDGRQRSWGDYGVHKCFESGYTDQHSK